MTILQRVAQAMSDAEGAMHDGYGPAEYYATLARAALGVMSDPDPSTPPNDIAAIARARLADGRQIADSMVLDLIREIERLRSAR